jgi:hypothetical protein
MIFGLNIVPEIPRHRSTQIPRRIKERDAPGQTCIA